MKRHNSKAAIGYWVLEVEDVGFDRGKRRGRGYDEKKEKGVD